MKNGGLARFAAPAQVVSLILSDVVGDPIRFIASGPTYVGTGIRDNMLPYDRALAILDKYGLLEAVCIDLFVSYFFIICGFQSHKYETLALVPGN